MPVPPTEEEGPHPVTPSTPLRPITHEAEEEVTFFESTQFVAALSHLVEDVFIILPSTRTHQALIHGEVSTTTEFMSLTNDTIAQMTYPCIALFST